MRTLFLSHVTGHGPTACVARSFSNEGALKVGAIYERDSRRPDQSAANADDADIVSIIQAVIQAVGGDPDAILAPDRWSLL